MSVVSMSDAREKKQKKKKEKEDVKIKLSPKPPKLRLTKEAQKAVEIIGVKECGEVTKAALHLIEVMGETATFENESRVFRDFIIGQIIPSIAVLTDFNYVPPKGREEDYLDERNETILSIRRKYSIEGIEILEPTPKNLKKVLQNKEKK